MKIPKFSLFGEKDSSVDESIQPALSLRDWGDLESEEKNIAFQEFCNNKWLDSVNAKEVLQTIEYLNSSFLRLCPGKRLHSIEPQSDYRGTRTNERERVEAAVLDFEHIFKTEKKDALVMRMLSKFLNNFIDEYSYRRAKEEKDKEKQKEHLGDAFRKFDWLANCINHLFEQFAVNQVVTRSGIVPRQDKTITEKIYVPTLQILENPKWESVSSDLSDMFSDYRDQNYPEVVTKAHSAVQRFLQILVGEEGKNSKGEVGKLFKEAKRTGIISVNRFTESIINAIQSFLPSERAEKSTAKPSLKGATAIDALLIMNVVMVLLQYCLQNIDNDTA